MMGKGVANFSSGVLCLKPERGPWYDARDGFDYLRISW